MLYRFGGWGNLRGNGAGWGVNLGKSVHMWYSDCWKSGILLIQEWPFEAAGLLLPLYVITPLCVDATGGELLYSPENLGQYRL